MQSDNQPLLYTKSSVEGISWPPVSVGAAATLTALLHQFEASQWLPYEQILQKQHEQLVRLATHAHSHSPHFRSRLEAAGLTPVDLSSPSQLLRLPPLTRRDIQKAGASLYCAHVPQSHLPLNELKTSGSTGEPVVVKKTSINNMFWLAITMREYRWHKRNINGRLLIIRANIPKPVEQDNWGLPVNLLYESGPMRVISTTTDIKAQLAEIRAFRPDNLLVYPSNLAGLLMQCQKDRSPITGLRHIWCIGESLSPDLRQRAEAFFNVPIEDNYSSQEAGVMAIQCPVSRHYHVMAESVIIEIIDEKGNPCEAGQVGKVLVTDLHNFATPLVRYEVGDYAEMGAPCFCGRHLPVIRSIRGRTRNLIVKPDGTRHWPQVGFQQYRDIAPILQFQLIQHDLEHIEVRLVTETDLSKAQEEQLRLHIQKALAHPFAITFTYFSDRLPLGQNGKFEEFICRV